MRGRRRKVRDPVYDNTSVLRGGTVPMIHHGTLSIQCVSIKSRETLVRCAESWSGARQSHASQAQN